MGFDPQDCENKEFCEDLGVVSDPICLTPEVNNMYGVEVNQIMKIYDVDGDLYNRLQCDDSSLVNYGNHWCPEGYHIFKDLNTNEVSCMMDRDVCAAGFIGNINPECNNLFEPKNDVWGLYDSECVYDIYTANHYDSVCCLDIVLNNEFSIYSDTPIKIY